MMDWEGIEEKIASGDLDFFGRENPYYEDGKWYWYDEAYSSLGPYDTEEMAIDALDRYVSWLNWEY